MGWQKVPMPGPYSTNNFVLSQSTGANIFFTVRDDDGTIDPTIIGCLIKPFKKTPHGPKKRFARPFMRFSTVVLARLEDIIKGIHGRLSGNTHSHKWPRFL